MNNPDVGATEQRNCTKCLHYRKAPTTDLSLQGVGICVCMPPQVNMHQTRQGMAVGTAFPMVNDKVVCGQFRQVFVVVNPSQGPVQGGGDGS